MKKMYLAKLAVLMTGMAIFIHASDIKAQHHNETTVEPSAAEKNMMRHAHDAQKGDTLKWIDKRRLGIDTLHQVFDHRFLESEGDSGRKFIYKPQPEDSNFPCNHEKEVYKDAENMIDLNDPAIESFRKRKLKGGREKIVIIRNNNDG
jgi:hypothetical protein